MKVIGWFYVSLAALVFSLWPPTPTYAQPEDGCTSPVVTLFGEITQELATKVASSIIASDSEKCAEPMLLYINSPGGDIVAGSLIVDAMALSHRPVDTINVGEAASMAAIVYLKGHKRTAWPHAILMLHRSFHRMTGTLDQVASEYALWVRILDGYETDIATRMGLSLADYRHLADAELWMLPDQAIKLHLTDEIATHH